MKAIIKKHRIAFLVSVFIALAIPILTGQIKVPIPGSQFGNRKILSSLVDTPHWGGGINCSSCHVVHQSPGAQLTNLAGNSNLCISCHNPVGLASNKPFSEAVKAQPGQSGTSHAWDAAATNAQFGAVPPTNPELAARVMEDNIVCSTCHNQHDQTYSPFLRDTNYQNALCKDCHSVRNVGSFFTDQNNKGSHPVGIPYPNDDSRFYSAPQDTNLLLVDPDRVECTSCHGIHYTDSGGANSGSGDGYLLQMANGDTLCYSCHTYQDHEGMACLDCHEAHNSTPTNIFVIRDSIITPASGIKAVLFLAETGTNSFADGDNVYNGVCEVCHTRTRYHRNSGMGNHSHNEAISCVACHPHNDEFNPRGNCTSCHSSQQGGRRPVCGSGGDYQSTSHHVQGTIQNSDCIVCHSLYDHQSGVVKLLDADLGSSKIYEYSVSNPEGLEDFCLSCHDDDGALNGNGLQPFSDGVTVMNIKGDSSNLWSNSAHNSTGYSQNSGNPITCFGDGNTNGCHGNAHGSDNIKLLSGGTGVEIDQFCYRCHTQGMITNNALSGGSTADDIQQAFSYGERHNLGTSFSSGGNTYYLQCTTCHNPHVVTGKHWDVASGVTPVTRPDLNADPTTNPRAMGSSLWGDEADEKMDNFAARASGTGGWYYSTARGGQITWDQKAVYQPPKAGSGYNFEFAGDILPDYTSLCLDCHTNRVSDANPPVNWGQGISCTDNSVDPPDQRIECGAQHGLAAAGKPYYVSDDGTAGHWGASGNPDVLFHMNYVTRGRGVGHFMRWPYDSADRSAGINFVLSCTDCHEAHGSGASSMLRTTVNAYGAGTSIWNVMCNNCHYYYGGQHEGMSCANASCHEANSIHRIIHVTDSGAGTQLQLTASGYQGSYVRPDFTPDIVTAEGHIGSDQLTVTLVKGAYTNSDLSGTLIPEDFWFFDINNDNPKSITSVSHTAGDSIFTITLSSPLIASDLSSDILATTGKSVWTWYEGGYENWATGTIEAQAVSAGPWPVNVTGPSTVAISSVQGAAGFDQVLVTFSEAVFGDVDQLLAIDQDDFVLTDTDGNNPRSITAAAHTPGTMNAVLTMSSALLSNDLDVDQLAAAANSIFDQFDNSVGTNQVSITSADWPVWGTSFQFNELSGSAIIADESNMLIGTVNKPDLAIPGDGYFHGSEDDTTWIDVDNNTAALLSTRAVTIEARVKPTAVDLDWEDANNDSIDDIPDRNATFNRIFDRKRSIKLTIMHTWYSGDTIPEMNDKARLQVKYFVDTDSRHTCPDPQWPEDDYVGNDARWHQINSDIDQWPFVNDHWYMIRVVFNSDKLLYPGSNGTPVDIFIDDQGPNGDDIDENWVGYINASSTINESSSCRWGALPGDVIAAEDQITYIGTPPNHDPLYIFKGLIDWVTWKPIADYSGVDEPPY